MWSSWQPKSRETLGLYTFTVGKIVGITAVTLPAFSITEDWQTYYTPRGTVISATVTKTRPPTARLFIFSLPFTPFILIEFITFRLKYVSFHSYSYAYSYLSLPPSALKVKPCRKILPPFPIPTPYVRSNKRAPPPV